MTSFTTWLRRQQTRDDKVGELARFAASHRRDFPPVVTRLATLRIWARVEQPIFADAVGDAWVEYVADTGPDARRSAPDGAGRTRATELSQSAGASTYQLKGNDR